MATKIQKMKWDLHCKKEKMLLIWGLKKGLIRLYNDELIEKLRKVYYGGIPASIILLSNCLSNGHCYDRALLMSRAFLEDEDDIKLLYATIDSLKLNPKFICDDPLYADHCIVERTTKDGRHLIYDTTSGFVYDKSIYWMIENPKIRHINSKQSIKKFIKNDENIYPEDVENAKYAFPAILSMLEKTYGKPGEMYSAEGIELLQREIEHYKSIINYDEMIKGIDQNTKLNHKLMKNK